LLRQWRRNTNIDRRRTRSVRFQSYQMSC
jgi:hypothetical protein